MSPFERLHQLRKENDAKGREMDAMRPRFAALRTRHEDGTAPRAVTAYQLFQTPPTLAARMADLADIQPHHHVLEPSAGLGRILTALAGKAPERITACEISPECSRELFQNFPDISLLQGDFLTRSPGTFDRIVMNPPFHMRDDIRHTRHALTMLAPRGVLVGLCLHTRHRIEALQPLADHWETIPAHTFKSEGTAVEAILFRIKNQ